MSPIIRSRGIKWLLQSFIFAVYGCLSNTNWVCYCYMHNFYKLKTSDICILHVGSRLSKLFSKKICVKKQPFLTTQIKCHGKQQLFRVSQFVYLKYRELYFETGFGCMLHKVQSYGCPLVLKHPLNTPTTLRVGLAVTQWWLIYYIRNLLYNFHTFVLRSYTSSCFSNIHFIPYIFYTRAFHLCLDFSILYHHEFSTMDDNTIWMSCPLFSPLYIYTNRMLKLSQKVVSVVIWHIFQLFHDSEEITNLLNHSNTNLIYQHIAERARKSHSSVQDLQSPTRLEVSLMLQIFDTMAGPPPLSLNIVIIFLILA